MTTQLRAAALLAVAFLALHLPFLPVSLEDLDSINFALGLRHFDVAQHQPHPPGYPVYIALSRIAALATTPESRALSVVSAVSGALAVLAIAALFATWTPGRTRSSIPFGGTLVAVTAPLFWMTAARPLSDMTGLAAAIGAQVMTVRASTPLALGVAALAAGVGAGIRSQVVWLTLPLLALAVITRSRVNRLQASLAVLAGYGTGVLLWGVPLVILSGGPAAYVHALATQGAEDFTGVAMLATRPSPRLLAASLSASFLAPWGWAPLGVVVLAAAAAGVVACARTNRTALLWLAAAFGPYAAFDLLFQETATTRYALPLVVPIAFLAAHGCERLRSGWGTALTGAVALASLAITMPALRAYARTPAPAFRVLEDMRAAPGSSSAAVPVLSMHRRQELDMRRPIVWNRERLPAWSAHLPAPPKHEWLELVKYWNSGGRAPVWFLADPPRSDLRLIDAQSRVKRGEYRWSFEETALIGGVRPNVMDWYAIEPPTWYLGEGWSLTPETAGVARDEGHGPGKAPIQGWIRRHPGAVTLMVGGRNFAGGGPEVPVAVSLDGLTVLDSTVAAGFFLRFLTLDAGALIGDGDYAALAVTAGTDQVAIEQFDLQPADRPVYGFGDGWQELEYNPATGRLWRWMSERGVIRLHSSRQPLILHLNGEFETAARTAHIIVRVGDQVISEHDVARAFTLDVPIPAEAVASGGETLVTLETDQWYVPAETNWRPTQDRRHLGLRLFECEIRPAS